jgi:hypothetical protein
MEDDRGHLLVLNPLLVTLAEDGELGLGGTGHWFFSLVYDDISHCPLL